MVLNYFAEIRTHTVLRSWICTNQYQPVFNQSILRGTSLQRPHVFGHRHPRPLMSTWSVGQIPGCARGWEGERSPPPVAIRIWADNKSLPRRRRRPWQISCGFSSDVLRAATTGRGSLLWGMGRREKGRIVGVCAWMTELRGSHKFNANCRQGREIAEQRNGLSGLP